MLVDNPGKLLLQYLPICKDTLSSNRSDWLINCGHDKGDVTKIDWTDLQGEIDIIHGGPPCQPFSIAGEQKGIDDNRNMWGEFSRVVNTIKPKAFVAENVLGILSPKFQGFVKKYILDQLSDYSITKFEMHIADYGVWQIRRRVFFVGFKNRKSLKNFSLTYPCLGSLRQKKSILY